MTVDDVVFTMDTDWSPPEVVDYAFSELIDSRLAWTVFCTDFYSSVQARNRTEMALHYNVEGVGFEASFRAIAKKVPGAQGARGHSLAFSERLRPVYRDLGIVYDSSYLMVGLDSIHPFQIARNVWELPLYFMDTFFLEFYEGNFSCSPSRQQLGSPGLKILDFHPVHLVLNTPSIEYYNANKSNYHSLRALLSRRYKGRGVCSMFGEIQNWALSEGWGRRTLLECTGERGDGRKRQPDAACPPRARQCG
jgi:hypothetical protein